MVNWEALSDSPWFVVSAYVAAFLPWTALANTDLMSSKWVSVKRTRKAGRRNLVWTFLPMVYVIAYGVVQWKAGDYKEMAAAVTATVFAALIGIRTMWGLWQLHEFHQWAHKSIDALKAVGIEYSLLRLQKVQENGETSISSMTSGDIANEILVNEKIVDNQIVHGEVQCFLKVGKYKMLNNDDYEIGKFMIEVGWVKRWKDVVEGVIEPLHMGAQWIFVVCVIVWNCMVSIMGKGRGVKVKQVPKEPVEVWAHWAATFASQGLQKWISEFNVARDPNVWTETEWKNAKEKFDERGRYFGSQLVASAILQLWGEDGGVKGLSPFLWEEWKSESEMSDGRIVKQEVLKDAMEKGRCLPFEASQLNKIRTVEDRRGEEYYTYIEYEEVLREFISELPVRSSFVKEMGDFDVETLEWLTILLHLGCMCGDMEGNMESTEDEEGVMYAVDELSNVEEVEEVEGLNILFGQLGLEKSFDELKDREKSGSRCGYWYGVSGIPLMRNVMCGLSEGNRLVCKVGELIDVWLSLVCGEQVETLVELNDEWEEMCMGSEDNLVCEERNERENVDLEEEEKEEQREEEHSEDEEGEQERKEDEKEEGMGLRDIHRELEKRRLERRIASGSGGRYEYVDGYVTFMGYRMEAVRTVLGRYVECIGAKSENEMFQDITTEAMENVMIDLDLSKMMSCILKKSKRAEMVGRRGVMCRLIWELQNGLEKKVMRGDGWEETNEKKEMEVATMMLMVLSFPGLKTEVKECEEVGSCRVEQNREWSCIDLGCWNGDENSVGRMRRNVIVEIGVMCGAQAIGIEADIGETGKCSLKVLNDDGRRFRWEWWRDAFIGRLEGLREWQESVGISGVELEEVRITDDEEAMKDVVIDKRREVRSWRWWPPFRVQICRLELECEGILRELQKVGKVGATKEEIVGTVRYRRDLGELPVQDEVIVSYDKAKERVLKDSRMVVREALKRLASGCDDKKTVTSTRNTDDSGDREQWMGVCSDSDSSGHEKSEERDETISGGKGGLRHRLEEFVRCSTGATGVGETVEGLRSFVGGMLSPHAGSARVREGREADVEDVVLPACKKLIEICADSEAYVNVIMQVLETCLAVDAKHGRTVMRLMQQCLSLCDGGRSRLACMRGAVRLLELLNVHCSERSEGRENGEMCVIAYAEGFAKENYRTAVRVAEQLVEEHRGIDDSDFGDIFRLAILLENGVKGVARDAQRAAQLYERAIHEGKHVVAMGNLGVLLENGAEGVEVNTPRAMELYERAIREGNDVVAMVNLGLLLENGAEGVAVDAPRAMELYERAIREENHVYAMNNLGWLLHNGAEGVEVDAPRAMELYDSAIRKGNDVGAMNNLGWLLHNGAEGVEVDAPRAKELYERAIREGNDLSAVNNLGLLLHDGAEGVPADAPRAKELYERAIREGNDVGAMVNLGWLLHNGAEGVPADAPRAMELYESAIREGNDVSAMYNLGSLLREGAEGVPMDARMAVKLYERAIREGNDVDAMLALGLLLQSGAEGVPADALRAVELYERAIRGGNDVDAMVALGLLLHNGAEGVPMDAPRAMELYERAIRDGNDVDAKNNLAGLLNNLAEGVPADEARSKELLAHARRVR